ncbi:hypothetical protein ACFQL1_03675 [Halomicroarcula sp. GCM10025709]|uniref:hypothetical protein n=1 Tax=Haloarcula TaxID=2237 RepID=UPI0024C3C2CF|nr:hypothetical protein [Halomicroarcula sp. YJ-61-S]
METTATDPGRSTATRRGFLAAVGAGAVAGCAGIDSGPEGEGDTVEIIPVNESEDPVTLAVRVEDADGEALMSRVYDLPAGHADESEGVDTPPATVVAFTQDGRSNEWAYEPRPDLDCPGQDVGIRVSADGIEPWYSC